MLVRKARCPRCGAAKVTRNATPWIYCDYCAQLMDFDHDRLRGFVARTGDTYDALSARLAPAMERARAARDWLALIDCHRQLQDQYVDDCRALFPPRLADPAYRAALVAYRAHVDAVRDLDPRLPAIVERVDAANAGLELDPLGERWVVRPSTLWPIVEANAEAQRALRAAIASAPHAVPDPDDTPDGVAAAVAHAFFVHGWLPMLDDATAAELLARTGLAAGYEQVPDAELRPAACPRCGAARELPAGARRAMCEACGHVSDVGAPVGCVTCGAVVVIGLGHAAAMCGHCRTEVRRVT